MANRLLHDSFPWADAARLHNAAAARLRRREGHAGRGGGPHQGNFFRREAVGGVDEIGEFALEGERLGRERAGGLDGAGVFVTKAFQGGCGEGLGFATDAFHFADESVGIEFDRRLELEALWSGLSLDFRRLTVIFAWRA